MRPRCRRPGGMALRMLSADRYAQHTRPSTPAVKQQGPTRSRQSVFRSRPPKQSSPKSEGPHVRSRRPARGRATIKAIDPRRTNSARARLPQRELPVPAVGRSPQRAPEHWLRRGCRWHHLSSRTLRSARFTAKRRSSSLVTRSVVSSGLSSSCFMKTSCRSPSTSVSLPTV